jgi:uncharacterized membrane protein YbhN (UPF0104 family)
VKPAYLRTLAWVMVAAAAGYLGVTFFTGWSEISAALARLSVWLVVGILALSLVNYGMRFWRWQIYLRLLGHAVPLNRSLPIYFAAFALTATPGKVGESVRTLWLQPHGVRASQSLAAFLAERASDLFAVLLLVCLGLAAYPAARPVVAVLALVIVIALAVLAWERGIARLAGFAAANLPARPGKLVAGLFDIVRHARRLFAPAPLALGLAISVPAWGAEAVGAWLVFDALGASVSLADATFIYAFAMLVGSISFLPGGLGGTEATMIALLAAHGLPLPESVAATLVVRLATLWFAIVLGLVALPWVKSGAPGTGDRQATPR